MQHHHTCNAVLAVEVPKWYSMNEFSWLEQLTTNKYIEYKWLDIDKEFYIMQKEWLKCIQDHRELFYKVPGSHRGNTKLCIQNIKTNPFYLPL